MSANESTLLAHHFENLEQQQDANNLGMWMFLSTEIMFFGGIFGAYAVYRSRFFESFVMGSEMLNVTLGAINTAILIGSSLTMALAVRAAQLGKPTGLGVCGWLIATIILGLAFLGVKSVEWQVDYQEGLVPIGAMWHPEHATAEHLLKHSHDDAHPLTHEEAEAKAAKLKSGMKVYFSLYFGMTGLHALHMVIGFFIIGILAFYAYYGAYNPTYYGPVEVIGLYWHFVDIVWIFLFPLLYLIRH